MSFRKILVFIRITEFQPIPPKRRQERTSLSRTTKLCEGRETVSKGCHQ
ncbi:MAG: hypothetical protein ACTSXH_03375 [Promethearchaeota archaeon]